MRNTNPQNTPALQYAYEYVERWRKKHDAAWIADHVWNMLRSTYIGGQLTPWRGFSVEDYRLNADEAAFFQAKLDVQIVRDREAAERAEKAKLAQEAHQKALDAYIQHLLDNGITKVKVKAHVTVAFPYLVRFATEAIKYNGEKIFEEANEAAEAKLVKLGFTNVSLESNNNWDDYYTDFRVKYSATYEVELALVLADDDDALIKTLLDLLTADIDAKTEDDDDICDIDGGDIDDDVDYEIIIPELVEA